MLIIETNISCPLNVMYMYVLIRERMVQQKIDRSGPVLFSRVRPAIQYRSSTDGLMGGRGDGVSRVWFRVTCGLFTAAAAAAAAAAGVVI